MSLAMTRKRNLRKKRKKKRRNGDIAQFDKAVARERMKRARQKKKNG